MKKRLIGITLSVVMILSLCMTAMAASGTWQHDDVGWWYAHDDGSYAAGTWEYIDGEWYHFDETGYMQTGWLFDNGCWYYLLPDGAMGTGWLKDDRIWYYLDPEGAMVTGWREIDGDWYYFDEYGRMHSNAYIDQTYFVDEDGRWDGVTIGDISDIPEPPVTVDTSEEGKITFTLHQNGWFIARLVLEALTLDQTEIVYLHSDSAAIKQTVKLTMDATKYEANRIGYQLWDFGWDPDDKCFLIPYVYTDGATVFTLTGWEDFPDFEWEQSSSVSEE